MQHFIMLGCVKMISIAEDGNIDVNTEIILEFV